MSESQKIIAIFDEIHFDEVGLEYDSMDYDNLDYEYYRDYTDYCYGKDY